MTLDQNHQESAVIISKHYPMVKLCIMIVFKYWCTIGSLFCVKDLLPDFCRSDVAVKLTCSDCDDNHIKIDMQ